MHPVASLAKHSAAWDKRHAVVDQLCRASESIVLNLAEGARLRSPQQKQQLLDYAVGSALECAACLDIAVIKQFLDPEIQTVRGKVCGKVQPRKMSKLQAVGFNPRSWIPGTRLHRGAIPLFLFSCRF
jgi:four helix bundle protein